MSWSEKAMGVEFKTRGKFLYDFLQMKSEDKNCDKFYKDVEKFIISSFAVRSEYRYVSEGVHKLLESWGEKEEPDYKRKYTVERYKENFTNEHTIPTSVVVDYIEKLVEKDREKLTAEFLAGLLEKVSGMALITKEEDKLLNEKHLQRKLPENVLLEDIISGNVSHSIRYEIAGITIFKTNDNARP
ncbi:hypothetical protein [uncultured Treponema sp.]|uniref:hypothetical protein n=1 Tax=uncultured Treponema sp. TaxID=162155 RepID=UPI0025D1D5F7|nr:hypothetical protein [uncultured Treponema sp.]